MSDISELIENKTDSDDVALQLNQLTLEELEKQSILATMKCLNIVKIMLQKAKLVKFYLCFDWKSHLDNSPLQGLVTQMILPAIESEITIIQEYGLDCLGLICALHKELAVEYMAVFLGFVKLAEGSVRSRKSCESNRTLYQVM